MRLSNPQSSCRNGHNKGNKGPVEVVEVVLEVMGRVVARLQDRTLQRLARLIPVPVRQAVILRPPPPPPRPMAVAMGGATTLQRRGTVPGPEEGTGAVKVPLLADPPRGRNRANDVRMATSALL